MDQKVFCLLLFPFLTSPSSGKDTSFDVLILTQHWPYTTCMDWKERSEENSCRIPPNATWSLHGLWPTRMGEINPHYCNDSAKFDPSVLEPIMKEMETYWPDVEIRKRKDSLWQHEWVKHGTCAAQLEIMDSEVKYFEMGCELGKVNPISSWLEEAGVFQGGKYDIKTVWEAVVKGTNGTRPHIDCDHIEGKHFLSEIKICYDKNLTRVNCDGIKKPGKLEEEMGKTRFMGTCPHHKKFVYPSENSVHTVGGEDGNGDIAGSVGACFLVMVVLLIVGVLIWRSAHSYQVKRAYEAL